MAEAALARQFRVKIEGASLARGRTGFSTPVYAEPPELFPLTNTRSYTRGDFATKYGLSTEGPNPKSLTAGDVSEAELEKFLGPTINKNGHRYMCLDDEDLITEIERMWMVVHQKSGVLSNRLITKGMARGFFLEKMKQKKVNWASYAEWTSSEQRRRRVKLKKQGRAIDEDTSEMDDLPPEDGGSTQSKFSEGGSISDRQGVEVLGGGAPAAEALEQWKAYLLYIGKEHTKLVNLLVLQTKAKDDYVVAECCARSQMEFCFQKLEDARDKLDHLNAEFKIAQNSVGEGCSQIGEDDPLLVDFRVQIKAKEGLVVLFEGLAADAELEHRRVSASESGVCAKVANLEADLDKCVRNEQAIKLLLGRLELGSPLFRSVPPTPYLGWEVPDSKEWLALDKCCFCGLGFSPIWAVRLTSCKHAYHELCYRVHFQISSTCCELDCKEEMHEKWWSAVGLLKPGTDKVPAFARTRPPVPKPWAPGAAGRLPTVGDAEELTLQDEMLEPNGLTSLPGTGAPAPSVTNCGIPAASQPSTNMASEPNVDAGLSASSPPQPRPGVAEKDRAVLSGHLSPKSKPLVEKSKCKSLPKGKESLMSAAESSPKKKPKAATRVDLEDAAVSDKPDEEEDPGDEEPPSEENGGPEESDTKTDHEDEEDDAFQDIPASRSTKKKGFTSKRKSGSSREKRGKNVAKRAKVPVAERKSSAKSTRSASRR